jgi:ethanolamine ammonia-lyase small subunit
VSSRGRDSQIEVDWTDLERRIRSRTPARLLKGRAGASYLTSTQLDLRDAHAAARDAIRTELDMKEQFSPEMIKKWGLFEVSTAVRSKDEYLLRPDLGRVFNEESQHELRKRCSANKDMQIAIGDGLSVTAVSVQVAQLLPALCDGANTLGWTLGQTFVIRHCRVGILNQIGEILRPTVAVLLIGERPGLATAESLSAYMAYRPCSGQTDADRNLVSNVHAHGVGAAEAVDRILGLAAQMMKAKCGGVQLTIEPARFPDR